MTISRTSCPLSSPRLPLADDDTVPVMHQALQQHDLLPAVHLMEAGDIPAKEVVGGQGWGVDLFGPTRDDSHGQARNPPGFAAEPLVVDWQHECATCPVGKTRSS
ncbi:MAG TPA: hypothetical protein VGF67_04310 [Ktedonobacteraceae bacterium]|jgi:hypothetical protein